jgi:hypothetical protein
MNFASRWQSHIEFSRHARKKRLEGRVLRRLRKEGFPRLSVNVAALARLRVRLHRDHPNSMMRLRVSASVRSVQIRVLRVARPLKDRVRRLNVRVLRREKILESEECSAAKKISARRISSGNVHLDRIVRRSALRRAITNAVLANSAGLKAVALVRRDRRVETSASVHHAAIDLHVANSPLTREVKVLRARRSGIAKRASVLANRQNVSNAKVHSKDALLEEIVQHAKVDIVVQTLAVVKAAQEAAAHAVADREAVAHAPVDRVRADKDRVGPNLVARAAVEEAHDLHFVAISFSDTLIRGTYLCLCRRSPNLYRSA